MKIEVNEQAERIYIIPEDDADRKALSKCVPAASEVFAWYTFDSGKEGEPALVITTHKDDEDEV